MIDVVIPAYNAHKTIKKTLMSIATQTISHLCRVTIVNDSAEPYDEIIKEFKPYLDLREICLEKNGGPGVARRVGLENAIHPYVTFIDADDYYIDSMFFEGGISFLQGQPKCVMISANFLEQYGEKMDRYYKHENDMIWVFGKIYRVSNLRKKGITFSDLRANEDLEFNTKIRLSLAPDEYIKFVTSKYVYNWCFNENSITRENDGEYTFHHGLIGSIHARDSAFSFPGVNEERAQTEAQIIILGFYDAFNGILQERPERNDWLYEVFAEMSKFYDKWGKKHFSEINLYQLAHAFNKRNNQKSHHIIPTITLPEFLMMLNNGEIDDEIIKKSYRMVKIAKK